MRNPVVALCLLSAVGLSLTVAVALVISACRELWRERVRPAGTPRSGSMPIEDLPKSDVRLARESAAS